MMFREKEADVAKPAKTSATPAPNHPAAHEESIREWIVHELIEIYNYPRDWLGERIALSEPRSDSAVRYKEILVKNEKGKPFIVIRATRSGIPATVFARAERELMVELRRTSSASVGMITDGSPERTRIFKKVAGLQDFRLAADLPEYDRGGHVCDGTLDPNCNGPFGVPEMPPLKPLARHDVEVLFRCHSVIRDIDGMHPGECLDEICKVIFAKIWDERVVLLRKKQAKFRFHSAGGTEAEVASNIRGLYVEAVAEGFMSLSRDAPELQRSVGIYNEPIKLSDKALLGVVRILQDYGLTLSDADIKGMAFQQILGSAVRSGMGQYFTPEPVVDMIVEMLNPKPTDLILDPFCGSGHFLSVALRHVRKGRLTKEEIGALEDPSQFRFHGIEKSDRMCRIAMTDIQLHEAGNILIQNADALLSLDNYAEIWPRRGEGGTGPKAFSMVMTNPPFGSILQGDRTLAKSFTLAEGRDFIPLEVLGLERSLQFLQPGGILAIVLPESVLNTKQMQYVRDFIFKRSRVLAIVSLPPQTFAPFDGVGKASVVVLQKDGINGISEDYDVFVAVARHVGYDSTGRPDTANDLPNVAPVYHRYVQGLRPLPSGFALVKASKLRENISADRVLLQADVHGWPSAPLKDLCRRTFNGATPPRSTYLDSGFRIIKVRDLSGEGLDWEVGERAFVSKEFFARHSNCTLTEGDIVLTASAHHPKYIGLKIDIVDRIPREYHQGVLPSAELMVIRADPKKVNPYYLLLWLRSEHGYRAIQSCVTGQTAHIYPRSIEEILVPLPPPELSAEVPNTVALLKESLLHRAQAKSLLQEGNALFRKLISSSRLMDRKDHEKLE